jgi:ATP-binding cassette, subfamily C, bacterial
VVSTSFPVKSAWLTQLNPWPRGLKLLRSQNRRVKTPTVLQMEAVECGAAALSIILGYYNRFVPLPELRHACGVSRDGSKASNILKAARNYKLEAKGFKKSLQQLQELSLPYIIFWNFNHFLVVEGFQKQRVYLNDPATGRRSVSFQEFDEGYTGVVLVMEPEAGFVRQDDRPHTIRSLWRRLQGATGALAYCVLTGFLLTIVGLVIPVFSQIFVDDILIQGRQLWLRPLLLAMAVTVLLQGSLTILQLRYLRRLKAKLAIGMSAQFLWHLLHLPIGFYTQRYAGEISDRAKLNDQVAEVLSGQLATTVINSLMVIFYALVMFQYDWILTAILIGFASINVLTLRSISRQRVDANQRMMQEYGKVGGTTVATLQSLETIKASGLEADAFARWAGYYAKAANSQQELEIANKVLSILPPLLSALAAMMLLVVGGLRVMDGHLSIGMLIAFQGLMQSFMQPVNNLVNFGSTLQDLEGNLARLDDVLRNPTDPQLDADSSNNQEQSIHLSSCSLQGQVELQNITFGYSPVDPPLIENFNLSIQPGQRIALVGGSGSGKSTITKLLSGLYLPWSGDIYFDGQSRQQLSRQILTNSIAVVDQDILLFQGTVRENLTLWDATISHENLVQACQHAAILDVVLSLPGGYDAELTENAVNLSGGQRQRLEIARALVNNPSILIMDEATSALDAETEQTIDRNLRLRGCTCIIVAHRLSTIRDCDEIIVLEKGKVVQRGTHQQLWQVEGVYSQLIRDEGGALHTL